MIPSLVTAPAALPVSATDVARRLRLADAQGGFDADDLAQVTEMVDEVIAYLDGWHGVLRRAIMPQTWAVTVDGQGPHVLPMPDVTEVTVSGSGGDVPAEDVTLVWTPAGPSVAIDSEMDVATITFVCALPAHRIPAARALVKFLVAHRFENREPVVTGTIATTMPIGARDMISALRWDGGFR